MQNSYNSLVNPLCLTEIKLNTAVHCSPSVLRKKGFQSAVLV